MTRIQFEEMKATIKQAFLNAGMPEERADTCARIHTESSRDGVYSHGLNRVERFVEYIGKGWVDVNAVPMLELQWQPCTWNYERYFCNEPCYRNGRTKRHGYG